MSSSPVKSWRRSQDSSRSSGGGDSENGLMHLSPRSQQRRMMMMTSRNTGSSSNQNASNSSNVNANVNANRIMVETTTSSEMSEMDQILSPTVSSTASDTNNNNSIQLMNSHSNSSSTSNNTSSSPSSPRRMMQQQTISNRLSPTRNTNNAKVPSLSSTYSTDSIIRRVEEEIAAARTAALSALSAQQLAESNSSGSGSGEQQQQAQQQPDQQHSQTLSPRSTYSHDSSTTGAPHGTASFENALGMIDEEFDDDVAGHHAHAGGGGTSSSPSRQVATRSNNNKTPTMISMIIESSSSPSSSSPSRKQQHQQQEQTAKNATNSGSSSNFFTTSSEWSAQHAPNDFDPQATCNSPRQYHGTPTRKSNNNSNSNNNDKNNKNNNNATTTTTTTTTLASTSWEEIDTIPGPGLQVEQVRNAWTTTSSGSGGSGTAITANNISSASGISRFGTKNNAAVAQLEETYHLNTTADLEENNDLDLDDHIDARSSSKPMKFRRADGFERVPDFKNAAVVRSDDRAATVIGQEAHHKLQRHLDHLHPRSEGGGGQQQPASEFLDFLKHRREELTQFLKQPPPLEPPSVSSSTGSTHHEDDNKKSEYYDHEKDAVEKTRSGTPTREAEDLETTSTSESDKPEGEEGDDVDSKTTDTSTNSPCAGKDEPTTSTLEKEYKEGKESPSEPKATSWEATRKKPRVADPVFTTSPVPPDDESDEVDGEEEEEDEQHFFDAAMTSTSSSGPNDAAATTPSTRKDTATTKTEKAAGTSPAQQQAAAPTTPKSSTGANNKKDSWLPSSWGISSSSPRTTTSRRSAGAATSPSTASSVVRNADRFFFKDKENDATTTSPPASPLNSSAAEAEKSHYALDRSGSPSSNVTKETKSTVGTSSKARLPSASSAAASRDKLMYLKEMSVSQEEGEDDDQADSSTRSPPAPPKLQREQNGLPGEKEFTTKPSPPRGGQVRCRIEIVSATVSSHDLGKQSAASMSPNNIDINNKSSPGRGATTTTTSSPLSENQAAASTTACPNSSSGSPKLSASASNGTTGVAVSAAAAMQAISPVIHTPPRPPAGREKSGESSSPIRRQSSTSPSKRMSNRIRFRDPYPVLKPPSAPRKTADIVADNTLGPSDVPIRWIRPKADLKQLIVAAMGSSLQRRSNACGALKVLTKGKKNQMTLVRTDSFLSSLIFAASQNIPAFRDREMALDARTRAIACIRAVCEPKDNRIHILTYPGMIEVLIKVIEEDVGEARLLACGACAMLAKGVECRETMAHDDRLVDLLSEVLGGSAARPRVAVNTAEEKKEEHPDMGMLGHDDDDDDDSSSSDGSQDEDSHEDDDSSDEQGSLCTHSSGDSSDPQNRSPSKRRGSDTETPPVDSLRKQSREKNLEFKQRSRASACAVLLHLSKHCAISPTLCANATLLNNVIIVSNEVANPIHTKCLEIILNLSRFPSNNARLTPYRGVVETMLSAGSSKVPEDRIAALRTLQNMSSDTSSKPLLATDAVLTFLTSCAMRKSPEEKEAAVSTLYNITTEPGAVVAITNTKNAVATLVHLAHNPNSSSTVRLLACEALATISLWLQTLAGTGKVPPDVDNVALPSQKTSGWERWD